MNFLKSWVICKLLNWRRQVRASYRKPRFTGTSADAVSADHRSLQVISLCSGWQVESG
jgi:hypothetical protein